MIHVSFALPAYSQTHRITVSSQAKDRFSLQIQESVQAGEISFLNNDSDGSNQGEELIALVVAIAFLVVVGWGASVLIQNL